MKPIAKHKMGNIQPTYRATKQLSVVVLCSTMDRKPSKAYSPKTRNTTVMCVEEQRGTQLTCSQMTLDNSFLFWRTDQINRACNGCLVIGHSFWKKEQWLLRPKLLEQVLSLSFSILCFLPFKAIPLIPFPHIPFLGHLALLTLL